MKKKEKIIRFFKYNNFDLFVFVCVSVFMNYKVSGVGI